MPLPTSMSAMVLTGHGGLDKLMWRDDIATPQAGPNEVLIRVLAASVNNTDINTRTGWYSAKPSTNVSTASTNASTTQPAQSASAVGTGWSGAALAFPLIQGADCCGEIVQVGAGVSPSRVGERVMVRALQAPPSTDNSGAHTVTFGTDYDGAFAQYSTCASHNAIAVHSTLSAVELASFPCAFSTAEGMIQRANLGAERVLITGASGGVGSAAVQLCKRRGAHVTAITTSDKAQHLKDLGANATLDRDQALESQHYDVVLDVVGGPRWAHYIDALRTGGRYTVAGAVAGPLGELDLRILYLRNLSFLGCTAQPQHIFTDLVSYIEANEIVPTLAQTFPLHQLRDAQEAFLNKNFIGKIGISVAL